MNQNERREKISEVIGLVDDKYITEAESLDKAEEETKKPVLRLPRRTGWIIAAAAVLVLALAGTAAFMISAEAREYKAAVTFFEENDLPMEGLTRAEIKEVFRDITTRRFESPKTEELIRERVAGYEILQDGPTPEDLANAWDFDWSKWRNSQRTTGYSYEREIKDKVNETGYEVFDKSILKCFLDGELIWTTEITDFFVEDCFHLTEGTIVWGYRDPLVITTSQVYHRTCWMALLDDQGEILWSHPLRHGYETEYVAAVLDNGDGTIAVISRGDSNDLALSQYDLAGKKLSFHKTDPGANGAAVDAARLDDGYLVRTVRLLEKNSAHLVRIDANANILETYDYEGEDCIYYLTGMIQYGGKIYLSGYSVPKAGDTDGSPEDTVSSRRNELSGIYKALREMGLFTTNDNEVLTPLVRANYTAILLVCDSDIGDPRTFWSAEGSLGGVLRINGAGELEWDVESIESTFTGAFSSFSIGGTCKVFRYIFDPEGKLLEQKDTGETTVYRR